MQQELLPNYFKNFFCSSCSFCSFFVDTSLWCYGSYKKQEQVGHLDTVKPSLVLDSVDITFVTSGELHAFCLNSDSDLICFGYNDEGQLGVGPDIQEIQPMIHPVLKNISLVACGLKHTLCVDNQGCVWSFGRNRKGQLGLGDRIPRTHPEQIPGLTNIVVACCGASHNICMDDKGSLWSFGKNNDGQLGIGNTTNQEQPTKILNFNQKVNQICCGYQYSVLLDDQGSVWSFGDNFYGQLGLGSDLSNSEEPSVVNLTDIQSIACGAAHTVFLDSSGNLWTCGDNHIGQLGQGDNQERKGISQIYGLKPIIRVSCGLGHTICLDVDGDFWIFGCIAETSPETYQGSPKKMQGLTGVTQSPKKGIKSAMSISELVDI